MALDRVEVDGLNIACEVHGSGPPLLLLHGYVGDGASTWRPQLDGLSDEFTVVAWDAPGAGRSSDPPEPFGMSGYADCLAAFIKEAGLDRPHVLGLSFGGALALALNDRHPDLVRSLILASAYAGWGGSLPAEDTDRRLRQALALSELPPGELVDALMPTMFAAEPAPELRTAIRASLLEFHPAGLRAMARAAAEDLRPVLPRVHVPTLLIYGDEDIRAPLPVARALEAAIASATLTVLPGIGHVCNLEAPDEFNRVVTTFLHGVRS